MDQSFVLEIPRRWLARNPVVIRNRYFFLLDIFFLLITPTLALILRLDGTERIPDFRAALVSFTLLGVLLEPPIFYRFGLYKRYWRYASIEEMLQIVIGVFAAALVVTAVFFLFRIPALLPLIDQTPVAEFVQNLAQVPRSIPFISAILMLLMVGGSRFALRSVAWFGRSRPGGNITRVAIVGAGDAGSMTVRELQRNPELGMEAIAFFDDDHRKHTMRIHGVPVVGGRESIAGFVKDLHITLVIIAMPTAPGKSIRDIVSICEREEIETKTIPGIYELLDGTVHIEQLRNVEIEDLLRRETVRLDPAPVQEFLTNRRVLVTGGGGSIGSELCRQILQSHPSELVVLGHGENSVYQVVYELEGIRRETGLTTNIQPVIADIRFKNRVESIFEDHRPEIVFHAAAHKHVPLMEANPSEAVSNNVQGTRNIVELALATGVEHLVMISTDKAVNPTSVMGASKRVAELLVYQAAAQSGLPYVAVRFGNVLGSRGSVVPRFKEQIAAGGPVTVTHPDVERYFMTIPESVQLVLQAAAIGTGGEIFVLDMGDPIKIVDLAADLIQLSGYEVGRDIDIVFTQMRPGEKMKEELFPNGDAYQHTKLKKILIANNGNERIPANFASLVEQLENSAMHDNKDEILRYLHLLAPEFQPKNQEFLAAGIQREAA